MDKECSLPIAKVLACVLKRLCANNSNRVIDPSKLTKFHALRPPSISILDYLERICKYACCSPECYVLCLIYIDRLIQRSNFILTSFNVHRVIITSITLAAKFFDDQFFDNAYYARVGGISKSEMNSMELDFLFLINFSLFVSPSVYNKYFTELSNHANNRAIYCENCVDGGISSSDYRQASESSADTLTPQTEALQISNSNNANNTVKTNSTSHHPVNISPNKSLAIPIPIPNISNNNCSASHVQISNNSSSSMEFSYGSHSTRTRACV